MFVCVIIDRQKPCYTAVYNQNVSCAYVMMTIAGLCLCSSAYVIQYVEWNSQHSGFSSELTHVSM